VTWLNAVDQSYREEFRDLFESNFGRLEARLRELDARVEGKLDRLETRLVRWMFGLWIGAWVAVGGTLVALQRLL
jgi:hypothetical protein